MLTKAGCVLPDSVFVFKIGGGTGNKLSSNRLTRKGDEMKLSQEKPPQKA